MSISCEPNPKRTKSSKSTKGDEKRSKPEKNAKRDSGASKIKVDPRSSSLERTSVMPRVKPEPPVKSEPEDFSTVNSIVNAENASQQGLLVPKQEVRVKAEPKEEIAPDTVPFESLIDPAIRDGGSMNPLLITDTPVKKEARTQPTFTFNQHVCGEVESKTTLPGLPLLEILSIPEAV